MSACNIKKGSLVLVGGSFDAPYVGLTLQEIPVSATREQLWDVLTPWGIEAHTRDWLKSMTVTMGE